MKRVALMLGVLVCACARPGAPELTPPAGQLTSASLADREAGDASLATIARTTSSDAALDIQSAIDEPDAAAQGAEFIEQARILFRLAACGPDGEVPSRFDIAVVTRHCEELARAYDEYRKTWVEAAESFLSSLRPNDLPATVVYPFGGGDLASALATFPEATEITTISLEPAGDVRPIDALASERLGPELAIHRAHLERLLEKAHSRTDNLEKESKTDLPGEVLFSLAALVIYGYEPISLRYFQLRTDGSVAYVTQADILAQAHHPKALRALFEDAELQFRTAGDAGPVRILRHLAFNLDDDHLEAAPSLLLHLSQKGMVSAMTKAASHLLWSDHFSRVRAWLIQHLVWMVSDSTGIPPRFADTAGLSQETYGRFAGPAPFGLIDSKDANDFKHLFASQPARDLAFRYGYPDRDGHAHLIVTKRAPSH
ncbi:MAG: hypothetical protein ABSF69_07880 [Polyangiaceae bacterium]